MSEQITKHWYKEMTVYQIWPRSFKDSNGDGIGDLRGIIDKLSYIKNLGADAIWFSPLYPSPNNDYGYDIADYTDINSEYGTLDDMKELIAKAHGMGIKIIMDLVINHTSNRHKWFEEACKSRENPYHDYYIWREGKGKNGKKLPNNWTSNFPGPAWEYVPAVDQYYLHLFAVEQPDLNHDNPRVREEIKQIMRFWLDLGIDGFREDVITYISKKQGLPNGFPLPVCAGVEHYNNGPHIHEYLGEYKKVLDEYDCMTVGEAPMMTTKLARDYITEGKEVLNMMFNFEHMGVDGVIISWIRRKFKLPRLKKIYDRWQTELYPDAWNALYLENHDQPRIINRFGDLRYHKESAKMLATMYICQRGTPFIYQGQEIGMTNIALPKVDDYKDISTQTIYKLFRRFGFSDKTIMKKVWYSARDNARTPVQWSADKNAGFTTGEPWFNINPNYTDINVEANLADEDSILNYYKKLLALRRENELLIYGDFKQHFHRDKKLFVYERNYCGKKALIVCSFADQPMEIKVPKNIDLSAATLVLCNYNESKRNQNARILQPYESRVYFI